MRPPDVLVLGAGGILGDAWMTGVLAGLEECSVDALACRRYVGTSAGSIVAATLAAGVPPRSRLNRPFGPWTASPAAPRQAQAPDPGSTATGGPSALGVDWRTANGAALRRAALAWVPAGRLPLTELASLIEALGVRWDGRLRIAAVEVQTGKRVVFGAPGAPAVSVSEAVQASCAIPGVYRPLSFDGRAYVDGGVWSLTNMDVADVAPAEHVLCLNPTASLATRTGLPGNLGRLARAGAAEEAATLARRGATVATVTPDAASAAAMGPNLLDPRPRAAVAAAGLEQGRTLARHSSAA